MQSLDHDPDEYQQDPHAYDWQRIHDPPPQPITPQVDAQRLQTLLDTLEITDDPHSAKRSAHDHNARRAMADAISVWITDNPTTWGQRERNRLLKLRADRLTDCSTDYVLLCVDGEYQVHPVRCKQRNCPTCADARRRRWYHTFDEGLSLWSAPKHITLTIRSTDTPLQDQLSHLLRSFRRLRARRLWRDRTPWGYWTIEITYNADTGLWHPHIHIIANLRYLPLDALREAWSEITGGSSMCSIKQVKSDLARYLSKYVSKTSTVWAAPVDPLYLTSALRGKRLVNRFGTWPTLPDRPTRDVLSFGKLSTICRRAAKRDPYYLVLADVCLTMFPGELAASLRWRYGHMLHPPT